MDPWQQEFLETSGDKILCTGRQVGKSVTCGKDGGDYAIENPDTEPIVMIAPTERQARALFDKTLAYLMEFFPEKISRKSKEKPTLTRIILTSGVHIYCLPVGANGLGIRFLTIGRLYVDEASRIPEDVWTAITPALLTTGGDMILLSTPFGAQGEFYNTWINKDGAYDSFTRFSIDSEKVMRERKISPAWTELQREKALEKLEREKLRMTKLQFAQEYLGEFLSALRRLFSDELIKDRCILQRQRYEGGKHYLGVDVGRVYDPSTFEILWQDTGKDKIIKQEESYIKEKQRTTETARVVIRLTEKWGFSRIGVDDRGMGAGVLDPLLEDRKTKHKVIGLDNAKKSINSDGREAKLLKEDMYNHFLALMEQGKILLLSDVEVMASLSSVQYEYGDNGVIKIYGDYTHIVEGLIRAAWLIKTKGLNIMAFC